MSDIRLKVFYTVASHLSFTKAADVLCITQPAVTKNIKELETELDIRLFERRGNKITLTEAGEILYRHAESIFEIYRKIQYDLGLLKEKQAGELLLGASTTLSHYILPPILANFYKHFPDIRISLLDANTEKIEEAVLQKKVVLGIVEGKSKNKDLKYVPFLKDEIVAVVHTSQELVNKDRISKAEFLGIPLVLRENGSGSLEIIAHELHKHDISLNELNLIMQLGSTESIKSFLANSNCMALLSISAVSKEIVEGQFKIIDIDDIDIKRVFYFTHLQGQLEKIPEMFLRFAQNSITKSYNL